MLRFGLVVWLMVAIAPPLWGQVRTSDGYRLPVNDGPEIDENEDAAADPIAVSADYRQRWESGHEEIYLLRGRCHVVQGDMSLFSQQMVVWRSKTGRSERLLVYLEGSARMDWHYRREQQHAMLLELVTRGGVQMAEEGNIAELSGDSEPVFQRAREQRRSTGRQNLQPTQLIVPGPEAGPSLGGPAFPQFSMRRHVRISSRYLSQPLVVDVQQSNSTPPELIITVTRGVNIVVDNVPVNVGGQMMLTTVDLTADNAVIWTDAETVGDPSSGFDLGQDTPFQVYLEGNIVARQGIHESRATHAFYDVNERRGLLMNAEVRAFVPQLQTFLRLRAQEVRQLSESNFQAKNAWVSTSQMGRPGWRIESSDIFLQERVDPASAQIDPVTGQPTGGTMWVSSLNNRFYLGDVPLLYVPYLSAPADNTQIPLQKFETGYDGIFGYNVQTVWNLESLLGLELPQGANWGAQVDAFGYRGPGIGTLWNYHQPGNVFGIPTVDQGFGRMYFINDGGTDNLGLGRRNLAVPNDNRGRVLIRHRSRTPFGATLTGELGYISDRNFLEQYYEGEWDRDKDHESLLNLNQQFDNLTISGTVRGRLNDFSNVTNWWPRGDLTVLGEPIPGTWLTWSSHSSLGYGQIRPAQAPTNPADTFVPLPYFQNVGGLVAMTRHELDLPFNVGALNLVPYALGEAAYWEEDLTGNNLGRLYGSAGVRGSLQAWTVRPDIRSAILGLNGLAHRMVFDFDYSYSQANQPVGALAIYNEFDDNAQERFRERFNQLVYGGVVPGMFDPRFYAVRSGAARGVTDPYHELVGDLNVLRMGWRHRWQTKVGPPERPRIRDWMTLNLQASYFPNANRDNFGEDFGLIGGNYAWHVGERTTLLADALYDLFAGGQQLWSVGILSQRSARGSMYLGFRQVKVGPIQSQLVAASYSYVMSPKWVSTFGTQYDVAQGRDRGQSMTITRIGEYALMHIGLGYDRSRNNVSVGISIEPRLGGATPGSTQLSNLLGIPR